MRFHGAPYCGVDAEFSLALVEDETNRDALDSKPH